MPTLYLFPIEEKSSNLAKQYSEQICQEISRDYPLCKYLKNIQFVNISSNNNGAKFVPLDKELSSAFQVIDGAKASSNVENLVPLVISCLNNKDIKHKSPLEFQL